MMPIIEGIIMGVPYILILIMTHWIDKLEIEHDEDIDALERVIYKLEDRINELEYKDIIK